ncbi:MAG: HsdM family class I SAM-dependent methyltransferase [Solirubrobacteraceae bacterium]
MPGVAADEAFEVTSGGEPKVLFLPASPSLRAARLSYSRESPYVVNIDEGRADLHSSRRWTHVPGDAPLASADLSSEHELIQMLDLLRRDRVLIDAPLNTGTHDRSHEPLAGVLGRALARLRTEVAESDAYQDVEPRDTAVLRLFHQILYVRVVEDRGMARSLTVRGVLEDTSPGAALVTLLGEYEATLDSELFLPSGVDATRLPTDALRDVLLATVEPWTALELDFSVARSEIASRLYESYLKQLPVRRSAARSGRLFPVAQVIDEREQRATFYTPPALAARLAAGTLAHVRSARPRILDPACGSGAFLVAAYRCLRAGEERRLGRPLRSVEREGLIVDCLFGVDIDERALGIARVQLLDEANLSGGRLPSLAGNLMVGDALAHPPGSEPCADAIDWGAILARDGHFDCVLANPPFGAQSKLLGRLSTTTIEALTAAYPEVGAFGKDYAYYFVALARRLTNQGAAAGFVLPRPVLNQEAGKGARRLMSAWGVAQIDDLRAAKIFPGTGASVCTAVLAPGADACQVNAIVDSRTPAGEALDALAMASADETMTVHSSRQTLAAAVESGWSPFQLRWQRLRQELDASMTTFGDDARRVVRTGIKPARVADYVLSPGAFAVRGGLVEVGGARVPLKQFPEVVRSGDLRPFDLRLSGDRVLVPFDESGRPSSLPDVQAFVADRGGLPRNYQHGDLAVLRGPKILLTAFAREPAAFADVDGRFVPMMRGVHALALDDVPARYLPGVAALLQSSFYQWLLRGLGAPRADESVEITTSLVKSLPWPVLDGGVLQALSDRLVEVREAFTIDDPIGQIHQYAKARERLDQDVFSLVGASSSLAAIVQAERVRVA